MRVKISLLIIFFSLAILPASVFGAESSAVVVVAPPVKILLVPGHDNEIWGAQYGNVKEAAMNLAVASRIYNILKKDKRLEVRITRDTEGYAKEFSDYLSSQKNKISAFKTKAKKDTQAKIDIGSFIKKLNPPHNKADEDTAIKLYGINKWANENEMDAVVHVHFNDYPRKDKWTTGKRTGFAIYVPEEQMANSKGSLALAQSVFTQLKKKYTTSTYEKEKGGIVPDQTLIALGSNGTLQESVRSVLIEYGYIYEKKFRTSSGRQQSYVDMAKLTAAGIQNYFFKN